MTRKEEIEIIKEALIKNVKAICENFPTIADESIINAGKQLEKYNKELELL